MVSKETLKSYEFRGMEMYFDYIVESKANGQYQQVNSLIIELSKQQKKDFVTYIDAFYTGNSENIQYCRNLANKLI